MRSPQTVVHVVTLLEEMPVQETLDAVARLRAAGFPIGGVVVNLVREPLLRRARSPPRRRDDRRRGRRGPRGGRDARGRRPGRRRCSPRRATTPTGSRWSSESATGGHSSGRLYRLPLPADGIDASAVLTSWPTCCAQGWSVDGARPPTAARAPAPPLDVDALIADPATRIVVCCGSGGVGKTTTAAALGLRAAEAGRHGRRPHHRPGAAAGPVAGPAELDNTPRPVTGIDTSAGGRSTR